MHISDSINSIKGIGDKKAKLYEKLEISTIRDLLFHFPRTYHIYPEIDNNLLDNDGSVAAIPAKIIRKPVTRKTRRMTITVAKAVAFGDELELLWFRMPYISNKLINQNDYIFYGKITKTGPFQWKMEQPEIFTLQEYNKLIGRMLPVYSLTKGLTNNAVSKAVESSFLYLDKDLDFMPRYLLEKYNYENLYDALHTIHFPNTIKELGESRNRLVYDEFMLFFLQMYSSNHNILEPSNSYILPKEEYFNKVKSSLPFSLTDGQSETLKEIMDDFKGEIVTQRLIQGDVGSGKTIVAFLSMLFMVENGYQSAIMAPTEVLAIQHYNSFNEMIEEYNLPFETVLLTGAMTAAEKKKQRAKIKTGGPLFIIGTHALIQDSVEYDNLGLVVTDEQHRFGVKQRKVFSSKGTDPFVLVMSATPIPRTLALILYGDMKVSMIKDVPKTKLPIKNCVIKENSRKSAYQFIMREIENGHQAYIICPLVDASEKTEAENVTDYSDKLSEILPDKVKIGVLHGKMTPAAKTKVMDEFLNKEIDILVSTTVVEVGVNVVNATVIMIENANRFGLAQLHQLRGRVGRGKWQSYCILMDDSKEEASKRLEILNNSNDGFYIANEDLKLRGPGDFYGIRQSGDFRFKIADIYQDANIMKNAAKDAQNIISEDPYMNEDTNVSIKEYIKNIKSDTYDNL